MIECLVFEQKCPKRSWLPIVCGSWLGHICWIVGLHLNYCRPERIRYHQCVTRPNLKWLLPRRNSKLVANWETFWISLVQLRFLYEKNIISFSSTIYTIFQKSNRNTFSGLLFRITDEHMDLSSLADGVQSFISRFHLK